MTLEEAREGIGRKVVYEVTPWETGPAVRDEGVVTSVNERYVFVRFADSKRSLATYAGDLRWAVP